jgi:Gene product 88
MAALILNSLPADAKLVRLHVSGDFFSDAYFLAWMDVAKATPGTVFYT